jgi:hypothetical protein
MTFDTFEQGLLTELRGHVAERATARVPHRRLRWLAGPVAAAGAAIAIGVALLQPAAAYAVTESGDEVVVTISRLDDADGLEQALADHGIEAEVDYSGEAAPLPPEEGRSFTGPAGNAPLAGTGPVGTGPEIGSSLSEDALTLHIDPDTIPDDMVLHITTSGSLDAGVSSLRVEVAPAD